MRKEKSSGLRISLLGKPEVWLDDVLLTNFSTAKTEALLYFLAGTGQTHSREALAGLLWGEMPEAKARRNLTKSLSVLRRLLAPFLLIEAQRVGFAPDAAIDLDLTRWTTAVSTPAPTPDTITLYRGDFLAGFFVKDALPFEEWQLTQRERLRGIAIDVLENLVKQSNSQRDYVAGIAYGRRLLELDPWRESTHRQLMLMLARQGQHPAALAQYQQCTQLLADELGVEPMAETTALFQRIRTSRNHPALALPHELAPLVGREAELEQIQQRLQDPQCRLLTITGLGGMGKTRLAIAAAHQINRELALLFLNGVVFVSLAGVATESAVPLTIVNVLNVPLSSAVTPTQALLNFLRNQEILLVLDNFEHVTGAADLLLKLLQSCPDIKLLITSREPLNLALEWRLDLEGLPIPPEAEQEPVQLQTYASVALFVQSAFQVNAQFRLSEENAVEIRQLCWLVAGIPLALQLAATWLRTMSISNVLAALERDLNILATDMRDIPPRQRSLRAVFESTWLLLSAEERQTIEMLSRCRGGFTQKAAAEIAQATPFLLRRIIDRALLYQQDDNRYDLHPLTRQFAQEQLEKSGQAEIAAANHGRYYLVWLTKQTPALHGSTPQIPINAIEKELDNLKQAWQWAANTRQSDLLLDGFADLVTFYDLVGLLSEGEILAQATIDQIGEADDSDEERLLCRALIAKGLFITTQGQYEAADAILARALSLAQHLHDEQALADIYDIRGRILTDIGRYNEAKQQYWQALTYHRQRSNDWKTASALTNLGWTHIVEDNADAALPVLQEALILERKIDHKRGEAFVLGNLAVVYGIKGEVQKALSNQWEVLTVYETLGDLLNLGRAENNIGMTFLNMGRYSAALPHMQRAVELSRQIGTLSGLTNALDSLGTAYLASGHYVKASACLYEALESALEIGFTYMNYSVRAILVRLGNHTGDLAQAQEHLQQLRPLVEKLENTTYVARSLAEQAALTYLQDDLSGATSLMGQAIDILRQNPAPLDMPFFLLQQADYLSQQQLPADALSLVEEALATAQNLQHEPLQMRACALMANLFMMLGEPEAAQRYAEKAHAYAEELESYPEILDGFVHLGRYHFALGDSQTAAKISKFVIDHPASTYAARRQAKTVLAACT